MKGTAEKIRSQESEESQTVNIGDRAMDNLQFIRETMERSTVFTSVPGYGGALMGVTAVAAAVIAHAQPSIRGWLVVWLVEAMLAFLIGLFAMWQKTKAAGSSLLSNPARKLWQNALPPMICGVALTAACYIYGFFELLFPVWILSYGAAVVCGGAISVRAVPVMGWTFIAIGALTIALPASLGNIMMGLSFGVVHIVFGVIIGRRYGG